LKALNQSPNSSETTATPTQKRMKMKTSAMLFVAVCEPS